MADEVFEEEAPGEGNKKRKRSAGDGGRVGKRGAPPKKAKKEQGEKPRM